MQATSQAESLPDTADLRRLSEVLFTVTRAVGRHLGHGPVDRAAVAVLGQVADAGPVRLSDAAAALSLDLSTVSRQVQSLADAGYVVKAEDPADRRACLVSTTPQGRQVLDDVREDRATALGQAVAGWPDAEREALVRLLAQLAEDLGGRR